MSSPPSDLPIPAIHDFLSRFARTLVSPSSCTRLVSPTQPSSGHWFGGGNIVVVDRVAYMIGRYRDAGDSRFGLEKGRRGWCVEIRRCALPTDSDSLSEILLEESSWESVARLHKNEADSVLSFEGCCLFVPPTTSSSSSSSLVLHALISSEKKLQYPESVRKFQKSGTGIWTIDEYRIELPILTRNTGEEKEEEGEEEGEQQQQLLSPSQFELIRPNVISNLNDPEYLHLKDPNVSILHQPGGGDDEDELLIVFASSSYLWSSTVSGYCFYGKEDQLHFGEFPRGTTWDVGCVRVTCRVSVPRIGLFADDRWSIPDASVYFYDGCECVNQLGMTRRKQEEVDDDGVLPDCWPKGYSCEELGGVGWCFDCDLGVVGGAGSSSKFHRISSLAPEFVSPFGTGCLRYVSVLEHQGDFLAMWQMSAENSEQPLFARLVRSSEIPQE